MDVHCVGGLKLVIVLRITIKMWMILFYELGSNFGSEYGCEV